MNDDRLHHVREFLNDLAAQRQLARFVRMNQGRFSRAWLMGVKRGDRTNLTAHKQAALLDAMRDWLMAEPVENPPPRRSDA